MTKTNYNNTLSKRESAKTEHISNAVLIGLSNLYGIDLLINVPIIPHDRDLLTTANLTLIQTSLTTTFTNSNTSNSNSTDSSNNTNRRNQMKSQNAVLFNQLAEYIFSVDPNLSYGLTKQRKAEKTVKLVKYRWIDPFNEDGFREFGEGVINIVMNLGNVVDGNGKKKIVMMNRCDENITELYMRLLMKNEYLTENGKNYSQRLQNEQYVANTLSDTYSSQSNQTYQYVQNQNCQMNQNVELCQLNQSNNSYQTQQLFNGYEMNQIDQINQMNQIQNYQNGQEYYIIQFIQNNQ